MILKVIIIYLLIIYCHRKHKNKNTNKIINQLNYNSSLIEIQNLKKVVYTALLGKYDKAYSIVKEKGYDYFMFTDQNFQNQSNLNWTFLNVDEEIKQLNLSSFKLQRYFKTHPHLFFKKYNLSIYIDASFEIKGNLD